MTDRLEGYQPTKGTLDASNPPKGGSGISSGLLIEISKTEAEAILFLLQKEKRYLKKYLKNMNGNMTYKGKDISKLENKLEDCLWH